jgi:hypothetical protein
MRNAIITLFDQVATDYADASMIVGLEPYRDQGYDVHFYLHLTKDPSLVIHLQGYPGLSTSNEAHVYARLMNAGKMFAIRNQGNVSVGNEHGAVVKEFSNFQHGVRIPYNAQVLEDMIEQNIDFLRR